MSGKMMFWALVLCCLFSLVGVFASVDSIVTESVFDEMFPYRNDARCPANGFYTHSAFIAATESYPAFGTTGDLETQKREIAAFFGQTSQETTGGWSTAEGGPNAWGYCFKEESPPSSYCVPNEQWPCVPGQNYSGRGPIQLSYNYNYGPAGNSAEINLDLLTNPNIVKDDPTISFKTALWFWMTPQPPKPSCHDVMTGNWTPSAADIAAGRLPGYGVCTNIINGGIECGRGWGVPQMKNRIGFYTRHGLILNLSSYGDNLDCANQQNFGSGVGHAPF